MNETFENKTFVNDTKIKRALISVTDKKGIDILARELISRSWGSYGTTGRSTQEDCRSECKARRTECEPCFFRSKH